MDHAPKSSREARVHAPATDGARRTPAGSGVFDLRADAAERRELIQLMRHGPAAEARRENLQGLFGAAARFRAEPRAAAAQRKTLSAGEMMTLLQSVGGLGALLAAGQNPQGQTTLAHAAKELAVFEAHFKPATQTEVVVNAMQLAAVARTIGRRLALDVNSPWMAPDIAQALLAHYGPDIVAGLKAAGGKSAGRRGREAVALAGVLTSADPITLFMTEKITQDEAAQRVAQMARAAGRKPGAMVGMLIRQFKIELAAFDLAEVTQGSIGGGKASGREQFKANAVIATGHEPASTGTEVETLAGEADLIGELSRGRFEALLALSPTGTPQWRAAANAGEPDRLKMSPEATRRLRGLRAAVKAGAWPAVGPAPARAGADWARLSDDQKRHLARYEAADAAELRAARGGEAGVRAELNAAIAAQLHILSPEADGLVRAFEAKFVALPLTTSFDADLMFGHRIADDEDLVYESALKREMRPTELKSLLPARADGTEAAGHVKTLGLPHGMREHRQNENYMRWRFEKDARPTGYGYLAADELPEFSALSPSFAIARATESTTDFGKNQYGASHLEYRPGMHERALYQFTAMGQLRRSPMLLLHDIAVTTPGELAAAKAAYQDVLDQYKAATAGSVQKAALLARVQEAERRVGTAKTKAAQGANVLQSILFNVLSNDAAFIDQQQIEVRLFGEVDIATDVQAIHVDPAAGDQVKANVRAFCTANAIAYQEVAKPPGLLLQGSSVPKIEQETLDLVLRSVQTPADASAGAAFDAIAARILKIQRLPRSESALYDQLYRQATAAFNRLSRSGKTKARKLKLAELRQHQVILGR